MQRPFFFVSSVAIVVAVGCGSQVNPPSDGLGVLTTGVDAGTASASSSGAISGGAGSGATGVGNYGGGGSGAAGSSSGGTITALPPAGDGSAPAFALGDASVSQPQGTITGDPTTCAQAAQAHTYVGCDYWPTVVANQVWSIFDYAIVVANAGATMANVTVAGVAGTTAVPPGQLAKIYLPWVPALKGADADGCGSAQTLFSTSVMAPGKAYHLTSDVPVTVYQFNALEYKGQGGAAGKSWKNCPGSVACADPTNPNYTSTAGCYSFSNDASLLLPSTAMTGNYRVVGHEGWTLTYKAVQPPESLAIDAYMAVTGTQDGTTVNVRVSSTGQVAAGNMGIAATPAGGLLTFMLNAGDVAELVAANGSDLSGSVVQATAPVQVITGMPCTKIPPFQQACDHMEESVFPAETLGKDYVVTRPAGPKGDVVAHQVRIFGNVDGTHLTYNPAAPAGCPTMINAGQVVECGTPACPATLDIVQDQALGLVCGTTNEDFEIVGDQPFAVATFTLAASLVDPNTMPPNQEGDPAQSMVPSIEQFRVKYVFLAPNDYTVSYVDIVAKPGTTITLDGQTVAGAIQAIGTSAYGVYRVKLGPGQAGAHVLTSSMPVGIQVVGYGAYTSYMYPGGLNLGLIAPPPAFAK